MTDKRGDWPELVLEALQFSRFAVEMSALSEPELDPLTDFIESSGPLPFQYVSIHGPSKSIQSSSAGLADDLGRLIPFCDSIVMHPDTIDDYKPFRDLGRTLVIENMDARKQHGRVTSELIRVFEALPDARFCLDIAHAWSVDPSMELAHELLDAFGDRLRQIHISSLSDELSHVALDNHQLELFLPVLGRCRDVPWICEASFPSLK